MNDQSGPAEPKDPGIEAALGEYLERVDRGEPVDREEFLARHAVIADELRSFIAAEDEVRKLAGAAVPPDLARDSTKSFTGHGQETIAPQAAEKRAAETGATGLSGRFGRYGIIRALGKGAMGTVYLAEDTQLQRQVALKTPHFTEDPTGEQLERFFREARAAGNLRHPHICPIYDFGQIDGKHFITMAYIEGRPLSAFIQPDKPQTGRQILIVIRKLALALQDAHDHGIVHRDLKPANIMVDKKGEPIIMDFGLAQQALRNEDARLTQTGIIIGTPAFMSPEQVDGDPAKIGPSTDQYSLGVIFYELLTGQLPFRGSIMAVMGQILTQEPTAPSRLRSDLDPRIEAVCLKMMAKKPSERFPTLKAVADELAIILKSPSVKPKSGDTGEPVGTGGPAARASRPVSAPAQPAPTQSPPKAVTESDLASLEELARKCYSRRDFEQVIHVIERIPEQRRNTPLQALLEKSRGKADEISFLISDIDESVRLNDRPRAVKKADELLKIKPGHRRALDVQEKFAGYGKGGGARLGPLRQFTQPWNEGGWIPWSALAFGLAVFGMMTGIIVIHLRGTVVAIDIQDPGVEVAVKGTTLTVTGPDKQSVKVVPGDQELTISYADLKFSTKSFTIKKGETRAVTVSIVDSKVVANLDNEPLPLTPGPDQGQTNKKEIAAQGPSEKAPRKAQGKTTELAEAGHPPLLVAPFDATASRNARQQWADRLKIPVEVTNSIGMKLALIPAGEFQMGAEDRGGTRDEERPQHRVRITKPFYLGNYEITQGEFQRVMRRNPSYFSALGEGKEKVSGKDTRRFPVENVSWYDAVEFCNKLSESENRPPYYRMTNVRMTNVGRNQKGSIKSADVALTAGDGYRLPTEAEWEYACRAGTTTPFHFGTTLNGSESNNDGTQPYGTTAKGPYLMRTTTVGSYNKPNAFGLQDMHGNVREWCWDAYDEAYYGKSPESDPIGPNSGSQRVDRGGSWRAFGVDGRAAHRLKDLPGFRSNRIGLRVARGPVGKEPLGKEVVKIPPAEKQTADAVPSASVVEPTPNVATADLKPFGRPFLVRGEWTIENGELVQPTLAAGDERPLLAFGEESLSHYDLTLEAKKTGGRNQLGVYFHWLGPGHYRYFDLAGNRLINFNYDYQGKWGSDGNRKELRYSSNRWYSLKVEARGDTFRAYLDGVLQFEQTDPRFTHGRICIYTWTAAARFRRIKVSDPQGNVLFEGLPELPPASDKTTPKAEIDNRSRLLTAGETTAKSTQQQWADRLKTPVISTNSLGMKLAMIPPGDFQMGSQNSERERAGNEQQHHVRITKPFYLGVYEITQSEFEHLMGRNPSEFSNGGGQTEAATGVDTSRYPVEMVTWYDAVEFCNKLSEKEGKRPYYQLAGIAREGEGWIKDAKVNIEGGGGYRLPTEAQWEYACRAGSTSPFNLGTADTGAESNCDGKVPYGTEEQGPALSRTVPVGGYRPNAFGLHDMHGNVWEWCWDVFDEAYYKNSPESDPAGPSRTTKVIRKKSKTKKSPESDPEEPSGGSVRVWRGGGWHDAARRCRSAQRYWRTPGYRSDDLGFRVARSFEE